MQDLTPSGPLELEILVGRHVEAGDLRGQDVLHAGPEPAGKAQVVDGRLGRLLLEDALHLEQERLALLPVQLLGLTAEEIVNLGQRAEGEGAVLGDEGFARPSYSTPPSFAQAQRPRGPSSTSRRESPPPLGLFPRSAAQQPDPRAARRPLTTTRSAAHHPLGTRPD